MDLYNYRNYYEIAVNSAIYSIYKFHALKLIHGVSYLPIIDIKTALNYTLILI
jgi:hypothetical protein